MPTTRWKAPAANNSYLLAPSLDQAVLDLEWNQRLLGQTDWAASREAARVEVLAAAQAYLREAGEPLPSLPADGPLIVTGHQPELSHPGVWLKNFVLHQLARQTGGLGLNLIVDHDLIKSTSLAVPRIHSDPAKVRLVNLPYDDFPGPQPYEQTAIQNPARWNAFPQVVGLVTSSWGFAPLIQQVWSAADHGRANIGERFSRWRRELERQWGVVNLELPVSRLAGLPSFRRFAARLAGDYGFHRAYNAAAQAYRQKYRLRSRNHPVPDLSGDAHRWEVPYWVETGEPRRQPLFQNTGHAVDDATPLRPRALTLTLFVRLVLSDYFVHGLGGGKYDEVTDHIIQHFFAHEPPRFQVVTGTLRLPLPTFSATVDDVRRIRHELRDFFWCPDRHLPQELADSTKIRLQIQQLQRLQAATLHTQVERRERFHQFRIIREELRAKLQRQLELKRRELQTAELERRANEAIQRRDLAWILFPEQQLREFLTGF